MGPLEVSGPTPCTKDPTSKLDQVALGLVLLSFNPKTEISPPMPCPGAVMLVTKIFFH